MKYSKKQYIKDTGKFNSTSKYHMKIKYMSTSRTDQYGTPTKVKYKKIMNIPCYIPIVDTSQKNISQRSYNLLTIQNDQMQLPYLQGSEFNMRHNFHFCRIRIKQIFNFLLFYYYLYNFGIYCATLSIDIRQHTPISIVL